MRRSAPVALSRVRARDATIADVFEQRAEQRPHAVAVQLDGHCLTYGELDAAANRLAWALLERGVAPESAVGVLLRRSPTLPVALLGVLKAGGAYVPLDVDYPRERLAFMLEDTDATAIVTQPDLVARLPSGASAAMVLDDDLTALDGQSSHSPPRETASDSLAYLIHTSGSTGTPKAVQVPHRGIVRLVTGQPDVTFEADDAVLQVTPLTFDLSAFEIWGALLNGGRLVMHAPGRPTPASIVRAVREHGITTLDLATGLMHQVVDFDLAGLRDLRQLIVGGDVLSVRHARRVVDELPGCRLVNAYGPTEATVYACWHSVTTELDPEASSVPIGRPLEGTLVRVLDERGAQVACGEPGELHIGGEGVARGYHRRPDLTSERFVADPLRPGQRLYRTGDLVCAREDGELEFLGRTDRQLKVRGVRVEPGEVESALLAHPAVAQAAVVARETAFGQRELVAYVVRRPHTAGTGPEPRSFVADRLPSALVPARVLELPRLPLTPNGKLDRAALAAQDDAGAPPRPAFRPPHGAVQERLADLWSQTLRIGEVGADDDFLRLGGDSLAAMELSARIERELSVPIAPEVVLDNPTLGSLAARVEEAREADPSPSLPAIRRAPRDGDQPLSFSQESVWFVDQMRPDSLAYQFQALVRLEGDLDPGALRGALTEIVRRHEAYRTTFAVLKGRPVQRVHPPSPAPLEILDLSRGPEDGNAELERLIHERVRCRIDVGRAPLVRWTLARLSADRHVLIHVEHHLTHDGWSWAVFLDELTALYDDLRQGRAPALAEPAAQAVDFAVWQREVMDTPLAERQLEHWARVLEPPPAPLNLRCHRPRPAEPSFRGASRRVALAPDLCRELRALGAARGSTLYVTMLTAFYALLHTYSGRTDLCVGSGIANRRHPDTQRLVGMTLNTLALRADLSGDPTVGELIERVQAVAVAGRANQDVPFERVVSALAPDRDSAAMPYYQVLFSFQDPPRSRPGPAGLRIQGEIPISNGSAKADLNVIVVNDRDPQAGQPGVPGDLLISWEWSRDVFEDDVAERMLEDYRALLGAFVADPGVRLSQLSALPGAGPEPPQPGAFAPATPSNSRLEGVSSAYERQASIVDVFEARVGERPNAVAVRMGADSLSYRELDSAANHLAHRLRDCGVDHETPVGVFMPRCLEMAVALLGVLKAGGAYVPLDVDYPRERLAFMLEDTGAPVVVTGPGLGERLPDGDAQALTLDRLASPPDETDPGGPRRRSGPDSLAYLMYTSGSTGRPKAVEVTHRGVVSLVRGADYAQLGPEEVLLQFAPLAFDASTFEIWGALLNGGTLVMAPAAVSLQELGELVRAANVTTLWLSAGLFHEMVDAGLEPLRGLRQLLAGGDVLSPAHVRRALVELPGCRVINGYGPTESTTFACWHAMGTVEEVGAPVPIGRPLANRRVQVLDPAGRPVAPGQAGELCIGGDGLARGYHRRADLTDERFVERAGERLYRTGDRVRCRQGTLEFLGRFDHQLKIRGFRVEPGEIEAALGTHPQVSACAVVPREDGGRRRLVAFVVAADPDHPLDPGPLDHLRARLPAHMVPAAAVAIPALPLTANGKVDRDKLAARVDTAPSPDRAAPRTESERQLAGIWGELLKAERVGAGDDFFALGGDSLLAMQLFFVIEDRMGVRLPVAAIFEAPTLRGLAKTIEVKRDITSWRSLVPISTAADGLPFFCVHGGGGGVELLAALGRAVGAERPFYGLQSRGLDGDSQPLTDMSEMAALYVSEVRAVQPAGPYRLGGVCFGAWVAFEMAQQLQAIGQEVELLAAIDARAPGQRGKRTRATAGAAKASPRTVTPKLVQRLGPPSAWNKRLRSARKWLKRRNRALPGGSLVKQLRGGPAAKRLRKQLRRRAGELRGAARVKQLRKRARTRGPAAWARRRRKQRVRARKAAQRRLRARSSQLALARLRLNHARQLLALNRWHRWPAALISLRRGDRVWRANRRAKEGYRPVPYPGRVTLILSQEYQDRFGPGEYDDWSALAAAGLDVVRASGSHRGMLREPQVRELADHLSSRLAAR